MKQTNKKTENMLVKVILVFAIFSLGFFLALSLGSLTNSFEQPFGSSLNSEAIAPSDHIQENQISVTKDKIIIDIEGASLSAYAPTGSMKPLFNEGANGIRIVPESEDEINVGDLITFKRESMLIIHRVIQKGVDNEGTYFITKGDNNGYADDKVRFSDIKYITIGILY